MCKINPLHRDMGNLMEDREISEVWYVIPAFFPALCMSLNIGYYIGLFLLLSISGSAYATWQVVHICLSMHRPFHILVDLRPIYLTIKLSAEMLNAVLQSTSTSIATPRIAWSPCFTWWRDTAQCLPGMLSLRYIRVACSKYTVTTWNMLWNGGSTKVTIHI